MWRPKVEKTCTKCGKTKPLSEFHKQRARRDGHRPACKECACAASREWNRANKERVLAVNRVYYAANKEQVLAAHRVYYAANKEQVLAANRAYYAANREQFAARSRAYHAANRDRAASERLQRNYGISLADYDEALEAQDNGCAICGKTEAEEGKRLAVDHNHETDQVRGLLCENCNRAIGLLRHDPELLCSATVYLDQWGQG